ncbi:DUF1254 domain-containing protein [Streptomyces sp. NPDC102402]|uniref:DUF1254 domain-containing protein n=1 Tax=Streptomyces sp. NPDC102402 TaxID=3366169 RepID=UPI0038135A5C
MSSHHNAPSGSAQEVGGVPPGTVITPEFASLLARDVYMWGWPIVNAFHRRASFTSAPEPGLVGGVLPAAPVGHVTMLSQYIDPSQRWVAHPNQDVAYGFGYGAVDDDPVVLQVPDFGDRFWVYSLYDARSEEFSKLGRQYGTEPGNYLVVGPHWDGEVPAGITGVLRSPTELVAMGPRVFLDDTDEDRAAIQPVLSQVVIYPLSAYTAGTKTVDWRSVPHFPAPETTASETPWVDPETFFDELPGILDRVPALPGEESRYAMMRALLAAASSDPAVAKAVRESAAETETDVIAPLFNFRTNGVILPGGWTSPPNVARWGFDYLTRTATAKSNMYVNQPEETRYFFLEYDSQGRRLNGDQDYTITFPPGQVPPVNGFWSLTLYNPEHFFAPNDLGRYSLGTKNRALKFEADNSLTLHIQHESPGAEHESNWLPAPHGEFELTIRTYWPAPEVNEGDWTHPPVHQL